MKKVSERIRALRKERHITQTELGNIIGLAKTTISGYETDNSEPDYETLNKLANYFEVSVDYLLGRTENRNPDKSIILNNLRLVMGKMSPSEFVDYINDPGITTELIEAYLNEEITPQIGSLGLIANAIGVNTNFFYMPNTLDTLKEEKSVYKVNKPEVNFDEELEKLINKIKKYNLDIKLINEMIDILIAQICK